MNNQQFRAHIKAIARNKPIKNFPAPVLAEPQEADSLTQERWQDDGGEAKDASPERESTLGDSACHRKEKADSRGGENTLEQPQAEGSPWREWTVEWLKTQLQLTSYDRQLLAICKLHNHQLAAERENNDNLTKQIAIGLKRENTLSQQLAAERESRESTILFYVMTHKADVNYNKELKEKVNRLHSFLERCADHMICGSNIADTPLPTEAEWREILE